MIDGLIGIAKHITCHCARLSFSILLQDANVDATLKPLFISVATIFTITFSALLNRDYPTGILLPIVNLPHFPIESRHIVGV